ncbi:MAG: glutamate-5-semialdehyde dehydrogenase [Mariprofundales bacterium]
MDLSASEYMQILGQQARIAAANMRMQSTANKNNALQQAATILRRTVTELQAANAMDIATATERGLATAMIDRLRLTDTRIEAMAVGLEEVAALPDPVGAISDMVYRPSGIRVGHMRMPLGVVGMIYESRPNVTADAAALCLKSGNAIILRGGSEAIHSNREIAACLRRALVDAKLPQDAIQLIDTTDRALVGELLAAEKYVDVIIPRGGRSLIERVSKEAKVPVIKHLDGLCHVYIDADADVTMAVDIVVNAKVQRPGVCNALETVLVHQDIAAKFFPVFTTAMQANAVEVRGCELSAKHMSKYAQFVDASAADWDTEYLELILSVRVVKDADTAMQHIANHSSGHTESIITNNHAIGERFLREVDSSSVMWNASTRFADGFEYGLGAEIGISTNRLHARGPVGLEGLTMQKWIVLGDGQIRT